MMASYSHSRPQPPPPPTRPLHTYYSNDDPPPPPPRDMPPLPPGPPPSRRPFSASRDRDRNYQMNGPRASHGGSGSRDPRDGRLSSSRPRSPPRFPQRDFDFTFENRNDDAPRYPRSFGRDRDLADQYRPRSPLRGHGPAGQDRAAGRGRQGRNARQYNDNRNLNRNGLGQGRGGRFRPKPPTSGRPLLSRLHGDDDADGMETLGVADGVVKYIDPDEGSDSSEAEMDVSESEQEADVQDEGDNTVSGPPPAKKRATGESLNKDGKGDEVPRWSNPDPYYVLPPVLENLSRKRKDPVKQIRKSRKMAVDKAAAAEDAAVLASEDGDADDGAVIGVDTRVADNDDFISFDFGDKEDEQSESEKVDDDEQIGNGSHRGPRKHHDSTSGLRHSIDGVEDHYSPPPAAPSIIDLDDGVARDPIHESLTRASKDKTPIIQIIIDVPSDINSKDGWRDCIDFMSMSDPALGSRKRTYDDEIKGSIRGRGRKGTPSGSLVEEWIPSGSTNPIPWLTEQEPCPASAGFRLHKEICDFYDFVRPRKHEQEVRQRLLDRLRTVVRREIRDSSVECFGSYAAGLYLPNADMDVVVLSNSFRNYGEKVICQSNNKMYKFGSFLVRSGMADPDSLEVIVGAKVPLIKFVDRITSIKVDISFENDSGLIANRTFAGWKKEFPAVPVLVTIIKQFLMMRGLNEVVNGGLGGFSVTCLVVSLLHNMPQIQTGQMIPEHHLGELLLEFLNLYGNGFDIARTGINMHPPGYFDKHAMNRPSFRGPVYQASKADRISIIDPNVSGHDISGGSSNVLSIFQRFSRAHREILSAMKTPGRTSLLDWMIAGNYETFDVQREHLRELYNEHHAGDPEHIIPPPIPNDINFNTAKPFIEDVDSGDNADDQILTDEQSPAQPNGSANEKKMKRAKGAAGARRDRQRAAKVQKLFPHAKNIPPSLTPVERRVLVKQLTRVAKNEKLDSLIVSDVPSLTKKQDTVADPGVPEDPLVISDDMKVKAGKDRAKFLRRRFPAFAKEVPAQLTKNQAQKLAASFAQDENQPPLSSTSLPVPPIPPARKNTNSLPPNPPTTTTITTIKPISSRMQPPSEARKAQVALHLGGRSVDEAISID